MVGPSLILTTDKVDRRIRRHIAIIVKEETGKHMYSIIQKITKVLRHPIVDSSQDTGGSSI
jgi:hypothetical protein